MRHRESHLTGKAAEAMGTEPINKLLVRFSTPSIIAMLITASYSLVDSFFIGRLGAEGLAAIAVGSPLMLIYGSIGMGTGVGTASLVGHRLGEKNIRESNRAACVGITSFFIVGGLMTIISLIFLDPLLRLFGASDTVMPYARSYMLVETSFIVVDFFHRMLAELVRAEGHPNIASSAMITSGVLNCIWDPILGFGLGPFPRMGMAGFALATSVGRAFGIAILIFHLASTKTSYHFRPAYFLPDLKVMRDIYRVGTASVARSGAGSLSRIVANRMAEPFGVVPLAVLGVLQRSSSFATMPSAGLAEGMRPIVAYNYGARQKGRIGEVVVKAMLATICYSGIAWIIFMVFATNIMSLFNNGADFLTEGTSALRIFSLAFLTHGAIHILSGFFQGIGKGLPAFIIGVSRELIFLAPSILIFVQLFGVSGLWAAFPTADALAMVVAALWTRSEFRELGIPFSLRLKHAEVDKSIATR